MKWAGKKKMKQPVDSAQEELAPIEVKQIQTFAPEVVVIRTLNPSRKKILLLQDNDWTRPFIHSSPQD